MSALSGLAALERTAGNLAEAERLERRVQRYRERNPYYLLSLAREELTQGHLLEAKHHLVRAIALKADEPELYEAMVEVSNRLGVAHEIALWTERLERFRERFVPSTR